MTWLSIVAVGMQSLLALGAVFSPKFKPADRYVATVGLSIIFIGVHLAIPPQYPKEGEIPFLVAMAIPHVIAALFLIARSTVQWVLQGKS